MTKRPLAGGVRVLTTRVFPWYMRKKGMATGKNMGEMREVR
jgi:hypothetical protein